MDKYNKIHIWIGISNKTEEEYQQYFALDYSTEGNFETPDYKLCQFCEDIGKQWYDEDFIGIILRFEDEISIDELLGYSSTDPAEWGNIKTICKNEGIEKANAIFWYADAELTIPNPYKESYNGLKYIGMFEGD